MSVGNAAATPGSVLPTGPGRARWRRRLLTALLVLLVLLVLLALGVIFAPTLAVLIVRADLPLSTDHCQLLGVATAPEPPSSCIRATISPNDARQLLSGIWGHWIPPGFLRDGDSALGTVSSDDEDANTVLPWSAVVVSREAVPRLRIHLTRHQCDALCAPYRTLTLGPISGTWLVQGFHLASVPAADRADEAMVLQAAGSMHLRFHGWESELRVIDFRALITLHCQSLSQGWRPRVAVAITSFQVDAGQPDLFGSSATRTQLEMMIMSRLNDAAQKLVVPEWIPRHLQLEMELESTQVLAQPTAVNP